MKYADVILPLKLPWCPVYAVPESVESGDRVLVKLAGKEYLGVVWHTDVKPSVDTAKVKPVSNAGTGMAAISAEELKLWEFISGYYMCSIGEVYKSAYPASKIKSERIALSIREKADSSRKKQLLSLEKRVAVLTERLKVKSSALESRILKEQLAGKAGNKTGGKVRKDSGLRRKLETEKARAEENLRTAIAALERFTSQGPLPDATGDISPVPVPGTIAKGDKSTNTIPEKPRVIVSSERMELYLPYISKALDGGRQVLILAPEKAFLNRIEAGLHNKYPGKVLKYSSDATAVTRRKIADRSRTENVIVLGTRSSLFLPFRDLGLIVIDEEQDTFYKQTEPNPRYHGRDAAMALAAIHKADVILGTEYPSLETMLNCISGKYCIQQGKVRMKATTIDVNAERRKNGMIGPVSRKLIQAILNTEGLSVIIRGWEKTEEFDFGKLCPGKNVKVMTMQEFKREGAGDASLIGVLQADAFVGKDDFRADERAAQMIAQLSSMTEGVVIQTSVPERFTDSRSPESLLAERKTFQYPPYSRIIDINVDDNSEKRLKFICDKLSAKLKVSALPDGPESIKFRLFLKRDASLAEKKNDIGKVIEEFEKEFRYTGHIIIDIDPQ